VFDRPTWPLGRSPFLCASVVVASVEHLSVETRHDIEAPRSRLPREARIRRQPCVCAMSQAPLFAGIDGFRRLAMSRGPTALDFDEDQQAATSRDQIDLDTIRADVACDDAIPSRFEEAGGAGFALAAEPLAAMTTVTVIAVMTFVPRAVTHACRSG
jgi:hypothetical protein